MIQDTSLKFYYNYYKLSLLLIPTEFLLSYDENVPCIRTGQFPRRNSRGKLE